MARDYEPTNLPDGLYPWHLENKVNHSGELLLRYRFHVVGGHAHMRVCAHCVDQYVSLVYVASIVHLY